MLVINDGPKISYTFSNKQHKYVVDFYIQKINVLIELKDNHIWHKNQIASGKWKAKIDQIKNLLITNEYSDYLLITPKNLLSKINHIKNLYQSENKI